MKRKPARIEIQLGSVHAYKVGAHRFSLRDPYYLVLTISWPAFFSTAVLFYLTTNLCFALAYLAVPGSVNNARPGAFADHFFFSIETLATVGYGVMSPGSLYGHVVASSEIIFGMMSMAVITGLVFQRFSRPRARMLFSDVAVIAPHDGQQALMLRVVNERHQAVADATARLMLLRMIKTREGRSLRRFIELPLERATTPMIGLTWTLIHVIDDQSPLWGCSPESLDRERASLLVSISGYDESISAAIVARRSYLPAQLLYGREFVDILTYLESGEVVLDMARFHDTVGSQEASTPV